jgi:uncharacterized protein YjiK
VSRLSRMAALLGLLTAAAGCGAAGPDGSDPRAALLAERETRLEQKLAHPDSGPADAPVARWELPGALQEISGLVLTANGRLLTHGDSRGKVFEIDYRRGTVTKEFSLGPPTPHADFEAITMVGDTVVLLASDGVLYQFSEGANGNSVEYARQDTGLGEKCEFEGVAYDATLKALLLACKKVHDKRMKDSLIVYRWPLPVVRDTGKATRRNRKLKASYLAVPLVRVIGSNDWTGLHPSDITIDPFNGNYLLVASQEKALLEITPAGAVVFARPLPPGHDQAEGVAITKDSILIVSDEAKGGPALITLYRWRR